MRKRSFYALVPVAAALALTACASREEQLSRTALSDSAVNDKWEKTNRSIYKVSDAVDKAVLVPAAKGYRAVVPAFGRQAIGNAFDNLQEPRNFVNATLQGKFKNAFRAVDRFVINTVLTLGMGDPATKMGLPEQEHGFGQTLALWGVPSGPYFYMPLLGPSTVRDSFGFLFDFFADPVDIPEGKLLSSEEQWYKLGVKGLDIRSGIMDSGEQLLVGAADPYATMRSAWLQLRRYELYDGMPPPDASEVEAEEDSYNDLPPLPPLPDEAAPATTPTLPAEPE